MSFDGLLPVDKPAGPTSHDVVARLRRLTGARRVGHTGTLDPPATGLLLLLFGAATRLARFVPDGPKQYEGEILLGLTTSTDDLAGTVISRHDGPLPDLRAVRQAAAALIGTTLQVPPSVCARSVDGVRMYRAARRGAPLRASPAPVTIERLAIEPGLAADRFRYAMTVSPGTYVRAVARDLGRALGCGAAVSSLRRTAIGPFSVADAAALTGRPGSELSDARTRLIPVDAIPLSLGSVTLAGPTEAASFAAGVSVPSRPADARDGALVSVRDPGGRLLGVGASCRDALLPRVVLPMRG